MRRAPLLLVFALASHAMPWTSARAQDPAERPEDAEGAIGAHARSPTRLPIAARNPLDPTVAGTTVSLHDRPASGETLRDVLLEVPGSRVLSTGAMGQFNAVTLRGTELGQTSVMLDDLPIGGPDVGPVDLSLLPLGAFDAVEVYRGGAPAWLSDGAIGGVLRLVPRRAERSYLNPTLEAGAFGTYRGQIGFGVHEGPLALSGSLGVLASRQDFRFRNENGTLFDPSDDFVDRQRNAEALQTHQFLRARIAAGHGAVDLVYLSVGREAGYPGAGLRRTLYAEQILSQRIAMAAYRYERGLGGERAIRFQARLGHTALRNRFSDPYGGAGLGVSDSDDRTSVLSGRLAATLTPTRALELTAIGVLRRDHVDLTNHASIHDVAPADRRVGLGTLEARANGRLGRTRVEVRASYQIQAMRLRAEYLGNFGATEQRLDRRLLHTGRIGAVVSPSEVLAIQASVHRGVRAPSVLELFGNRSTVAANPELSPESGLGADLGAVVRASGSSFCLVAELRGFVQTMDDVIVIVPTSQYQARARNEPRAFTAGIEAGGRATIGTHLDLVGQWSFTRARDAAHYALPNRPAQNLYLRATVATGALGDVLGDLRAYVDVTHVGVTYLVPNELARMPARSWLGLGVELALFDHALVGAFSVRDATDVGGSDFLGYPLSGRSFSGTLSYRKDLP